MTLIISRKEVESVLTMKDSIAVTEIAFTELANGKVNMPQRTVIPIQDHNGTFLAMPAYIGGELDALGLKLVTVYPNNPSKYQLPTILGTLQLCNQCTGEVIAIMDAGYLTAVRTGAVSGVATKYLARENSTTCTVFGAGAQARKQIEAIKLVRPIDKVLVIDISPEASQIFADDMSKTLNISVMTTEDVEGAIRQSDIIVTATNSQEPLFDGSWLQTGTHINNIGSHSVNARELDTTTVVRSKFVADLKEANLAEAGDILIPIQEGAVTEDKIYASLGDIVIGNKPGRENDDEITVFKSCGLAIQDISTALAVYKAAIEKNIGTEISL